jgi:hypothetical protein
MHLQSPRLQVKVLEEYGSYRGGNHFYDLEGYEKFGDHVTHPSPLPGRENHPYLSQEGNKTFRADERIPLLGGVRGG